MSNFLVEEETTTGFGSIFSYMTPFPKTIEGKIPTYEFLQASKGVVEFMDSMGKMFAAVRYDIAINIVTLQDQFVLHQEKHKFLEDMIAAEFGDEKANAREALVWLLRELFFLARFFDCIFISNEECHNCTATCLKIAYSDTLEPYQGWMGSQLYNIISRFTPSRDEFVHMIEMNNQGSKGFGLVEMNYFNVEMKRCLHHIDDFLSGFDDEDSDSYENAAQ